MKIEAKKLIKFIERASLDNKISTINVDFRTDAIYSSVKSPDGVALPQVVMKATAFEDYEPLGEIFIRNSTNFIETLKTFDVIELSKPEEYLLTLNSDKRTANIILGSEIICDNVFRGEFPKLEFTSSTMLSKSDFLFVAKDKKQVAISETKLSKEGKIFKCEVGTKGESDHFVTKIETKEESTGKVILSNYFTNFLEVIDDKFVLHIGNNIPAVLEETTEYISYKCIIAPIIRD